MTSEKEKDELFKEKDSKNKFELSSRDLGGTLMYLSPEQKTLVSAHE